MKLMATLDPAILDSQEKLKTKTDNKPETSLDVSLDVDKLETYQRRQTQQRSF